MRILRKIRLEKGEVEFCDVCNKDENDFVGADFYVELELFEGFVLDLMLCKDCISKLEAYAHR